MSKPYRVIMVGDLVHDESGAAVLRCWVQRIDG
jgi:hypothetical protein